jgi:predicted nucleic acid-binding protein
LAALSLYLDTSSLLKTFVEEDGSDEMRQRAAAASSLATSVVTYAEARAALARLRRERRLSSGALEEAKRQLEEGWQRCTTVAVRDRLIREAGEFAERYRLKGCDSVQLASYAEVVRGHAPEEVQFSTDDRRLDRAARALASRLAGRRPPWVAEQAARVAGGVRSGDEQT